MTLYCVHTSVLVYTHSMSCRESLKYVLTCDIERDVAHIHCHRTKGTNMCVHLCPVLCACFSIIAHTSHVLIILYYIHICAYMYSTRVRTLPFVFSYQLEN